MNDPETQIESRPAAPSAPSAPNFAAASQPSYARTLFLGADGLRPGWGLAFYVLGYWGLRQLSAQLAYSQVLGGGLRAVLWDECGLFLAAVIPALVLMRVERRPWRAYGLPTGGLFAKSFWAGILWGFGGVSLLMIALYGLHAFAFGHVIEHGARMVKFAAFWAAMFLAVGLFEEFFFRGYSQFTLTRGIGFWPSAVILSSAFGLVHLGNAGEQWVGALAAATIGFFFCLTLRRTGNLWFAVGFHAAWDWGESFFYSVPDSGMRSPGHLLSSSLHGPAWLSGGSVGPEGSVLCFVVVAGIFVAFDRMYRKVVYPDAAMPHSETTTGGDAV
jgi:CAAX protease family protein